MKAVIYANKNNPLMLIATAYFRNQARTRLSRLSPIPLKPNENADSKCKHRSKFVYSMKKCEIKHSKTAAKFPQSSPPPTSRRLSLSYIYKHARKRDTRDEDSRAWPRTVGANDIYTRERERKRERWRGRETGARICRRRARVFPSFLSGRVNETASMLFGLSAAIENLHTRGFRLCLFLFFF